MSLANACLMCMELKKNTQQIISEEAFQSCSFEWSVYGQSWNLRMFTNLKNAFFAVLLYHLYIYLQLQHEASLSMEFLDNRFLDGFEVLFMKPVSFTQTFDQFLL